MTATTEKHPIWNNFKKLVRTSDGAILHSAVIANKYALTIMAGRPWNPDYYAPNDFESDNIEDYDAYQSVIYYGDKLTSSMSYEDYISLAGNGELKAVNDFGFERHGIHYGAFYWDACSGAMGTLVPKSTIEIISDHLCEATNWSFPVHSPAPVVVPQRNVFCRACGDPDNWNDPDFVGDGKYTCYRCRNSVYMAHKNVPDVLQDEFDTFYAGVDKYTKKGW